MTLDLQNMTFSQGDLYEWEWPQQGAGAMARMRGLRPNGKVVTIEDVPTMHHSIGLVGIQCFDDKNWIISLEWLENNGCYYRKIENYKLLDFDETKVKWSKILTLP